jgi:hypothetical protein
MQFVAGVMRPLNHVGNRMLRLFGFSFGEQISAFVLITQEARARGVRLRENQMADGSKTRLGEGRGEFVDVGPAVEERAKAVAFQHTIELGEGRLDPLEIVVADRSAVAGRIAVDVRRIGQNEIHAFGFEAAHDVDTVAVQDCVEVGGGGRGQCAGGHGVSFLCFSRLIATCKRWIALLKLRIAKGALQKPKEKERAHRRNFDCLFLLLQRNSFKKSIEIPRSRLLQFAARAIHYRHVEEVGIKLIPR